MLKPPSRVVDLRELLDSFVNEQKKDIYAYTWGHLNEARLIKVKPLASSSGGGRWASSTRQHADAHQESPRKRPGWRSISVDSTPEQVQSRDGLLRLNLSAVSTPRVPQNTSFTVNTDIGNSARSSVLSSNLGNLELSHNDIFVEELRFPDVRFPERKCVDKSDGRCDYSVDIVGDISGTYSVRRGLIPTHLETATRKESYREMMRYDRAVLRRSDTLRRDILHTTELVERLEEKLKRVT